MIRDQKNSIRINKYNIILWFLYFAPIIDIFVGIAMDTSGEDALLGKVYRSVFIVVLIWTFFSSKPTKICARDLFLLLIFSMIILPVMHVITNRTTNGLIMDTVQITKLVYPMILYATASVLLDTGRMSYQKFNNVLDFYSWFYPLSIVIPNLLGLGSQAYEIYDAGYRGFYSAGNEVSIVLVCMYIYTLNKTLVSPRISILLITGMNLYATLLTGTKVGMIMLLVGSIVIVSTVKKNAVVVRGIVAIIIAAAVVGIVFNREIIALVQENLDMMRLKYKLLNTDFLSYMLSTRNMRIFPQIMMFYSGTSNIVLNILFGVGYYAQWNSLKPVIGYGLTEMDFFDVLFQHGVIILVIVLGFYIKPLKGIMKIKDKEWVYKFIVLVVLIYATLAGHTLQSTLSSTSLCLFMILLHKKRGALK